MTIPLISVIIVTRNYGRYLGDALDGAIRQEGVETQIVVVDDGSDDNTSEVVSQYPDADYVRLAHSGVGAARNVGVQRADGDRLAFLDADDIWQPPKLRLQTDALDQDPGRHVVYGWVQEFMSDDIDAGLVSKVQARPEPYAAPIPSTLLIPRETLEIVGPFRENRDSGEALDWMLRFRERGLLAHAVDEVVTLRRIHGANSGRASKSAQHHEYLDAIRRSLKRRRDDDRTTP